MALPCFICHMRAELTNSPPALKHTGETISDSIAGMVFAPMARHVSS
jgi:hypothetical protein